MINSKQKAIVRKDIRSITSNKNTLSALIIVPLMMVVVLPTIFILAISLGGTASSDFQELIQLLPAELIGENVALSLTHFILNSVFPLFFLLIPVMASSVMAGTSFVGEKEKRTLETLLYSPLKLGEIFKAKILASFLLSMAISLFSFVVMMVVVEIELFLSMGQFFIPNLGWIFTLLLVSPALSLLAIVVIVRGSAKAKTIEESQQRSIFLILPIIFLMMSQFMGAVLINVWILFGLGVVFALIAFFALRSSAGKFTYETLLK